MVLESKADAAAASVITIIGPTEERGHRKWCLTCEDWTGHMIVPSAEWRTDQCTRCGAVRVLHVAMRKHARSQRALLVNPYMSPTAILGFCVEVLEPHGIARALEIRFRRDVRDRVDELLRQTKDRVAERKKLAEFSRL